MTFALMKDAKVMVKTPTGAEWQTVLPVIDKPRRDPFVWSTREGAEDAARMQGATVIPMNQVRK